uniref:F-box and leucine-rich protein 22 n=1 Tax=Culex pipiens TaxID=7175 RepID=A0A8D8CRS6_CULPI
MLKRLELSSITVAGLNCCLSEYFDNLKYLKLINCNLPKQLLETFFSLCSELEDVVLESIGNVDDNVILELLQSSERLKKLTLNICPSVTDVSVDHIATYGLMLKQLTITSCPRVSGDALKKLNIASN